jgi:mannose-1-phosphate guanylyltransferase/mannose-6-phosphate isomerase
MLIAPSDHAIPDDDAFRAAVMRGVAAAQAGHIVTFGITPSRPETGYGYLELSAKPQEGMATPLLGFVEKPPLDAAQAMLESGHFLWNSGIVLTRADVMRNALADHAPHVLWAAQLAVTKAKTDLGFLRLDPESWAQAPMISIDYAVMEQAKNLWAVPFSGFWSDLGGWDSVWSGSDANGEGVVTTGRALAIDCRKSLLRSESDSVEMVGIGLNNIIAVAMNDAVLIADMSRAQDVKRAVEGLRAKGAKQADAFPKEHRPWGWFESLTLGPKFQVKRIFVQSGAALSLQSHQHRAEHWIVVQGHAEVTIGDDIHQLGENQSVYIHKGTKHRLRNNGPAPVILIEVQTGGYLGEDDIVRFDDVYARDQGSKR